MLRAADLESINRDYNKAALVNNLLPVAVAVYAISLNIIPFIICALFIGCFLFISSFLTFGLYSTRHVINDYQNMNRLNQE